MVSFKRAPTHEATSRLAKVYDIRQLAKVGDWVEQQLNQIAHRFAPHDPYSVELHDSPMRSGRDGWKNHPLQDRLQAIKDALHVGVAGHSLRGVRFTVRLLRKVH